MQCTFFQTSMNIQMRQTAPHKNVLLKRKAAGGNNEGTRLVFRENKRKRKNMCGTRISKACFKEYEKLIRNSLNDTNRFSNVQEHWAHLPKPKTIRVPCWRSLALPKAFGNHSTRQQHDWTNNCVPWRLSFLLCSCGFLCLCNYCLRDDQRDWIQHKSLGRQNFGVE